MTTGSATPVASEGKAPEHGRTFFGHPWGLANLFGVEVWERFSFYGMQAILVFYLYHSASDGGLGLDETVATAIVGAYGGMVYLACIGGGWVADRILGPERTLFYSAILIMIGHISLSLIPGYPGLVIGLVSIALGSGGLKTTASTVLGELYEKDDPRRDGGFSIFYMGINIGALFGPLLTGWGWGQFGFHFGFGLAAIGMAIGLTQYTLLRKRSLGNAGRRVSNPLPKGKYLPYSIIAVLVVVIIVVVTQSGIIQPGQLSNVVSIIAGLSAIILFLQMFMSHETTPAEKRRLLGFIPMFLASVAFFSIFQQQFTVLAVYSDQRLNRTFGSIEITPAWVNSINPVFIIIFAGVFATMWLKLGDRQPSSPVKYALALIVVGSAPFFFIPFAGGGPNSTPFLLIVWILFIFTVAELLISPVGLSLATKVAPHAFPTRMMSLHMLSLSIGTALSGTLAGFYNPNDGAAEQTYFMSLGTTAILLGVIMWLLAKPIIKAFGGIR
ncbi:peptide MFS transporter [Corynebacterium canis]|uniref:Peptide MFS transporter n=1 Tax=Corynebacterium canis TaxID=679663 RepID=A0A5C5UGH4_9CORY|nr:peptide MFS transporter [Corynebacterium canis]TWT25058.1 peptide MFS transporter [Corynebacterium canis]WJY76056.1 Di-/tripeptide transporter [Corynebacterium canis]